MVGGIGRPELWNCESGFRLIMRVIFRKVSEDATQTVYSQTVIVSKMGSIQILCEYQKDWGGEFSCPNITFEDDNFKAVEESGKPGNYSIYNHLRWAMIRVINQQLPRRFYIYCSEMGKYNSFPEYYSGKSGKSISE